MADIFAARNVPEKTKEFIYEYAYEHKLNVGEALADIAGLAREHLKESGTKKQKKKYKSFLDVYDELKFQGEPDLSQKIDDIAYGD